MMTLFVVLGAVGLYLLGMPVGARLQYVRNESRRLRDEVCETPVGDRIHYAWMWLVWLVVIGGLGTGAGITNSSGWSMGLFITAIVLGAVSAFCLGGVGLDIGESCDDPEWRIIPGVVNSYAQLRPFWTGFLWPLFLVATTVRSIWCLRVSRASVSTSVSIGAATVRAYKQFIRPELKLPDPSKIADLERENL